MKPIPNYPGYFADETGNIYSNKAPNGKGNLLIPRLLPKHLSGKHGRNATRVFVDGRMKTTSAAALVLETFVSPRPEGMYACHGPKGCQDDSLDNIYWATPSQNVLDKRRDGTVCNGEKHWKHKLTELQVRIIIRFNELTDKQFGLQTYLADIFQVSPSAIASIVFNKTWTHLSR